MIFVTLGSQKFQFDRLLAQIDELIKDEVIDEEVFAQIGYSKYEPKNYNFKRFINREEYEAVMNKSDKVITHGGTGAIVGALKKGKKVIAVPRLSRYKEHVDNHQMQIVKQFSDMNLIIACKDVKDLGEKYGELHNFKEKKYQSNTKSIINSIEEFITKEIK